MRRRIIFATAIVTLAALAATSAVFAQTSRQTATTDSLTVLGAYTGADQQSFQAVLSGFAAKNSGMQATFTSAGKDLAGQLSAAVKAGTPPDVAVLRLPQQSSLLNSLAASKAVQPIGFVAQSLDKYDAFTWKNIAAVGGHLYGLPFKVNDESAFWYDTGIFKRAGLQAPATWSQLQNVSNRLLNQGIKPFAVAGGDGHSLAQIFANVYLSQQGPARYDKLMAHTIPWTDASVKAAMRATASIVRPGKLARPIARTLASDLPTAAMQLFGAPPKAAMLFGGSDVVPVLRDAVAARPSSQFGAFAFPTIAKPPARVVGSTDVVVMLKDSGTARALVSYLATPDAATIWAKRGGFISPSNGVDIKSYPVGPSQTMAQQVTKTTIFRPNLAGMLSPALSAKLTTLLQQYVASPARLGAITTALEAAARTS